MPKTPGRGLSVRLRPQPLFLPTTGWARVKIGIAKSQSSGMGFRVRVIFCRIVPCVTPRPEREQRLMRNGGCTRLSTPADGQSWRHDRSDLSHALSSMTGHRERRRPAARGTRTRSSWSHEKSPQGGSLSSPPPKAQWPCGRLREVCGRASQEIGGLQRRSVPSWRRSPPRCSD